MRTQLCTLLLSLSSWSFLACQEKAFEGEKPTAVQPAPATSPGADAKAPAEPTIPVTIDQRPIEEVLCSEAPKLLTSLQKDSFLEQLAFVCQGNKTTQGFSQLISKAFVGEGSPQIELWKKQVGELYVTDIVIAYALKVKLENPAMFADLKAHDAFASGIAEERSKLQLDVLSRTPFPGRKSIEKVVLQYNLTNADGAGIFDKRKTEFNTYTILENRRDIILGTEELLEVETNQSYHKAQGLLVGIKAENGQSYLVFINHMVIKNRIDPDRLQRTFFSLNKGAAKILNRLITNSPK
jgi:hypothetical protein